MQPKDLNSKKQEEEKFPLPIYPADQDIFERSKEETFDENDPSAPDQQLERNDNKSPAERRSDSGKD